MNTIKSFKFSLLACLLAAMSVISGCGDKQGGDQPGTSNEAVTLQLNMKQGDSYVMEMDMAQKMNMTVEGKAMDMTQNMKMELGMAVKEVNGDTTVIASTFNRIAMNMKSPMGDINVDTKEEKAEGIGGMMLDQFKKMIGMTYDMKFDKRGKVISTNMAEVMAKTMPGSNASGMDMQGQTVPFPERPIKVGESWTADLERDISGQKIKMATTYTLKSINNGIATIGVDGKISAVADNKEIGTITGTTTVTAATGFTNDANMKMVMTMEIENSGTKMPMKMDTDIKMVAKPSAAK